MRIASKVFIVFLGFLYLSSCSGDDHSDSPLRYELTTTVSPANAGTVSAPSGSFQANEEFSLEAIPFEGYTFKEWAGDISGTVNPIQIRMNSDKEITAVFESDNTGLSSNVIGKWDIENASTSRATFRSSRQQNTEECFLFSIILNTNNTYLINSRTGVYEGQFQIESENSITLKDLGSLENISFTESTMNFDISLTDLCSASLQAHKDENYKTGECSSFLVCYDNSVWSHTAENNIRFLKFYNSPGGIWMEESIINMEKNCISSFNSNETLDGTISLVENNIEILRYLLEKDSEITEVNLQILENGDLEVVSNVKGDVKTLIFNPTDEADFDTYSGYGNCPTKTYVPDDSFERELIQRGYDDILDDYVLTENISSVESLTLSMGTNYITENITSLTGIEDFTSLEYLEVQSGTFTDVDLSKNTNLQHLRLWDAPVKELDLSKNVNLRIIFLDGLQITEIDLSNNQKLTILDISRSPLESLDISKHPLLEGLVLENDKVQELTTIENPNLKLFQMNGNPLTEIDLSIYPNLETLYLGDSNFDQLDISDNPQLVDLVANNNPALNCIQVNADQLELINTGSTRFTYFKDDNAEFSLDCSYD